MQVNDNNKLDGANFHKKTTPMHDLKDNFDKILPIVKKTSGSQLDADDNLQIYPNPPTLPDADIIGLSLLQEALSIDSEYWFWSNLRSVSGPAALTNSNRRRKHLAGPTEQLARVGGRGLRLDEDTFIVDSIPVPVAHIAREDFTSVCRKTFRRLPIKAIAPH